MQSLCSGKRRDGEEAILEEKLAEDFLELKKEMNLQIESVLNSESYTNEKESTPRLIVVKTRSSLLVLLLTTSLSFSILDIQFWSGLSWL